MDSCASKYISGDLKFVSSIRISIGGKKISLLILLSCARRRGFVFFTRLIKHVSNILIKKKSVLWERGLVELNRYMHGGYVYIYIRTVIPAHGVCENGLGVEAYEDNNSIHNKANDTKDDVNSAVGIGAMEIRNDARRRVVR